MKLEEHLKGVNLDNLIDRLNKYAYYRLKSNNIKDFEGKEPIDFVAEVLCRALEGTRDFEKANCTIEQFLFGCLKSEVSAFFAKKKTLLDKEIIDDKTYSIEYGDEDLSTIVIKQLESDGATGEEVLVFELWAQGTKKPSLIADELGISPDEVYNISKRLVRRLPKIRSLIQSYL